MTRRARIALISPQEDLDVIGLRCLHYLLLSEGFDSTLVFLPKFNPGNQKALDSLEEVIRGIDPQLIGISLMSHEFYLSRDITRFLKSRFPEKPIVWGGVHPTIEPVSCLEHADYVCIGEGERTMVEMAEILSSQAHVVSTAQVKSLKKLNNICYIDDGELRRNELHPLIEDLDTLPAYEHVPAKSYVYDGGQIAPLDMKTFRKYARYSGTTYSVISSRGCPFSCTYCCNNFFNHLYGTKKVRQRSAASVIAELERAVSDHPEIEYINFQDDCFIARGTDYLREFSESYKQKVARPFIIRSIPTFIKREKMEILKDAGLSWINLGLQSGSDRVCRDLYNRKSLKEDFLKAAGVVRDLKIAAFYDIILDNPFETDEERLETVETLMETPKPFYPEIFSLNFYYGTELYEKAMREYPEKMDNPLEKNYLVYGKTPLNTLIRLAVFLNPGTMRQLVGLYKRHPDGLSTKSALLAASLASSTVFEPLAYLRLIKMSQGGSNLKSLKVLPDYFKKGLERYLDQFRKQETYTPDV